MKISFCFVLYFLFTAAYSHVIADSSDTKLKVYGNVSLNSNGVASIPAFSLGKPAIIATLILSKNRFSYEPQLAYGLNFKPWYIDNWMRYKIIKRSAFELRTGVNVSAFFSEYTGTDDVILQSQKYFAMELSALYRISSGSTLLLAYWNDRGQDKGTLKGHFINVIAEKSDIVIGKYLMATGTLQVFYINYDGNNDGIFVSPKVSSSIKNIPFTIFFQGIQPLETNISPSPGFRWNLGISYTL